MITSTSRPGKHGRVALARAESFFAWLEDEKDGGTPLNHRVYTSWKIKGWTRAQVDQAVNILAEQGLVTVEADADGLFVLCVGGN